MTAPAVHSRRERLRAATAQEIKDVARAQVVAEGAAALSLRAVAREMGMTAPALYRYFAGRDELVTALIADLYDELADTLEQARDAVAADDIAGRLRAVSRALRRWALSHPAEFALLFGSPLPGYAAPVDGPTHVAGDRFGAVFGSLFAVLWRRQPFEVPPTEGMHPGLRRQLEAYAGHLGAPLPPGAVQVFLECWSRLYGQVCLEVFGQLSFALDDAEPMFEAMLDDIGRRLGLEPVAATP